MSVRKRHWTNSRGESKESWIVDYVDGQGKRRLKTFQRKKDADGFAATTHVEVRDGVHVADSATITVKEAGKTWIAACGAAGLERSTLDQYGQHLDLHIVPFIGSTKLSKVTVPGVRAFQEELRAAGRSPAMIKRVTVSLGSMLAEAQGRGLVIRNAVHELSRSRSRRGDKAERRQKARLQYGVDIPTRDEVRAIVDAAAGRWRPLLLTALFAGLRASELRGLRWSDIDLEEKVLHVRQRADRYNDIGRPKSEAGERVVPIPAILVNSLREWRLACPKGDLGLAFPNGAGKVESLGNIVNRGLKATQVAAGVVVPVIDKEEAPAFAEDGAPLVKAKYTGMHALRHWFASWCINPPAAGGMGLPAKAVQERLGHASIQMTLDVYGHLFPRGDDHELLAAAERALLG